MHFNMVERERDPGWQPTGDSPVPASSVVDAGDPLSAWVLETAPRAVAYATSLLGDRERAEDVVQDCYCRLLGKAHSYDLPRDGLKLLLTAISNACINLKSRRRLTWSLFSGRSDEERPIEIADRCVVQPEDHLLNEELESIIGQGLKRLPIPQRAALELKSRGHSQEEIAEILETTASNAGVLVYRARKAMEIYLSAYLGESR
jgi:RNA polymerase sigma-70 factor (ECF subfamily)